MPAPAISTIPRGASIYRFEVDGQNILLSFPHPALHEKLDHPFFGETIGRVTNRIEDATVSNLNGQTYQLAANNNGNTLHGGTVGWGKAIWTGPTFVRKGSWDDVGITSVPPEGWKDPSGPTGREGVQYTHLSPDGDEGFPGALKATVCYFEGRDAEGRTVLEAEYEIRFAEETPGVHETVVGMTNHSYFNLNPRSAAASPTLAGHSLTLSTAMHQTIGASPGIPDGTLTAHPNVPFPNKPFPLWDNDTNAAVPIDECFVLSPHTKAADIPLNTRTQPLQLLAELTSAQSRLSLRVESTEPAFQCYTGGFIDVPAWDAGSIDGQSYEGGPGFERNAGICIEPSRFVNAAGREELRPMVLLKQGHTYGARTRYTAWKA